MNSDSPNPLVQFDLCMCLSEDAINTQMETAWASWKARKKWTDKVSLFLKKKDKKTDKLVPSKEGITATIAPLKISLNVPDGKYGQVKVTITLEEGTVNYFDEGEIEEEAIDNWSFSFIADLDKEPVNKQVLKKIDPNAYQEVTEVIDSAKGNEKGLRDSVFSIEYLFMKFTSVDMLLIDNRNVSVPKNVPENAIVIAKRAIDSLLKGEFEEKFMLGTVVRRTDRSSAPTFAMTDFIFHVHTNPAVNTLDYLGVFAGHDLPQDLNAARSMIKSPWVQPELMNGEKKLLNGAMIISKKSYLDDFLIPAVRNVLGADTVIAEKMKYTFKNGTRNSGEYDMTLCTMKYDNETSWEAILEIEPAANKIKVSGVIRSKLYIDVIVALFKENIGYLHIKGSNSFSGTITLKGDTPFNEQRQPEPEKFNIQLDADINFAGTKIEEDKTSGLIGLSTDLETLFKSLGIVGETAQEKIRKGQEAMVNLISNTLEERLKHLKIQMNNYAFIPPGGGVFSYQNPHFSSAGNLYIDAIYHLA